MSEETLNRLYAIVLERRGDDPERSYIARRFAKGQPKIIQKFGEEAVETVIAAMQQNKPEIINESADMLFHWLILLADAGVTPAEVMAELKRREGISGLDEKSARKDK